MDTQSTIDAELLNAVEINFTRITEVTETNNPIRVQDFAELLNQLVTFEISKHDANKLITDLQIPRKLIGQDYYLLLCAK